MKVEKGWAFPDIDEFMVGQLKDDGTYQASHLKAALPYVKDWRLAVDCGAHVGTWSRLLSAKFERVIAIEPSADTFEALVHNLETFKCANVEARNIAVGAAAGHVSMVLEGRGAELKNTGARFVKPGGTIPLEAIDSWELPALGFLKMDIEGSECAALLGALQTLRRCQPIVLFENKRLWARYGVEREGPQRLLSRAGYRLLEPAGCDQIWGPA